MKYNNIEFEAIVATPGCGKSFLCDKYPKKFVDVDEERLKCKYIVPENITRQELEASKGERTFPRRASHDEYIKQLNKKLDIFVKQGKILIAAPHPEAIDYLMANDIKFCFVYPNKEMKEEIAKRMTVRGNPESTVKENDDKFFEYYQSNVKENRCSTKYEFGQGEYLEDILRKFDCDF